MSLFHLSVRVYSRSRRESAVAIAAYCSRTRLYDSRTGKWHDFSAGVGSGALELRFIMHPPGAEWALCRTALWNAAERAETRVNACVCRGIVAAIPASLSPVDQAATVRALAGWLVERFRVAVDVAIHLARVGSRNVHAHFLLSTREATPTGLGAKTRVFDGRDTGPAAIKDLRRQWADVCNPYLAAAGLSLMDARSYASRGISRIATVPLGKRDAALERAGQPSVRGDLNRATRDFNAACDAARQAVQEAREAQNDLEQVNAVLWPGTNTDFRVYGRRVAPERGITWLRSPGWQVGRADIGFDVEGKTRRDQSLLRLAEHRLTVQPRSAVPVLPAIERVLQRTRPGSREAMASDWDRSPVLHGMSSIDPADHRRMVDNVAHRAALAVLAEIGSDSEERHLDGPALEQLLADLAQEVGDHAPALAQVPAVSQPTPVQEAIGVSPAEQVTALTAAVRETCGEEPGTTGTVLRLPADSDDPLTAVRRTLKAFAEIGGMPARTLAYPHEVRTHARHCISIQFAAVAAALLNVANADREGFLHMLRQACTDSRAIHAGAEAATLAVQARRSAQVVLERRARMPEMAGAELLIRRAGKLTSRDSSIRLLSSGEILGDLAQGPVRSLYRFIEHSVMCIQRKQLTKGDWRRHELVIEIDLLATGCLRHGTTRRSFARMLRMLRVARLASRQTECGWEAPQPARNVVERPATLGHREIAYPPMLTPTYKSLDVYKHPLATRPNATPSHEFEAPSAALVAPVARPAPAATPAQVAPTPPMRPAAERPGISATPTPARTPTSLPPLVYEMSLDEVHAQARSHMLALGRQISSGGTPGAAGRPVIFPAAARPPVARRAPAAAGCIPGPTASSHNPRTQPLDSAGQPTRGPVKLPEQADWGASELREIDPSAICQPVPQLKPVTAAALVNVVPAEVQPAVVPILTPDDTEQDVAAKRAELRRRRLCLAAKDRDIGR